MQTDLRGQNHKEKKSGGEVKRSLRFVGTAAAVLVVLGLVLGLQQILFPNRLEKTYQGMLLYADGSAPEAVTVTVQGTYTASSTISQEETFLGGEDGGLFVNGMLLARNVPFSETTSDYCCIRDDNTHVLLSAEKEMNNVVAEFWYDQEAGAIVPEGEGQLCLLLAPAADEAEAEEKVEAFLALPETKLWLPEFTWKFE